MSVGAEEGGSGETSGAWRRQKLPDRQEDPLPGLQGSFSGTGGRCCRSLRGWTGEQATGSGRMDLEASLLPTGPNASNTSDGPDNLTSAGE